MHDPRTEAFVRVAASLPAMPEVAMTLLKNMDRDDLSLSQVADLVARDNALAAKVLRTANSARYSPSHTVASLNDAAATLGLHHLRDLTLAACLTGAFPQVAGFDRLAFWRGTLAMGSYAQVLARGLDVDEDAAYVAGLMLRTGQILVGMAKPDVLAHLSRQTPHVDDRFERERLLMNCTHADITMELARHWQFPAALVTAFGAAGDPLASHPFNRLGGVLRLASVVTDCRELGVPVEAGLQDTQRDLADRLQLDLAWLMAHLPDHALATAGVDQLLH